MSAGTSAAATWPADVIHVNEDGWVLINRGRQHGITVGLGLLVVGQGVRELRNLFAGENGDGGLQDLPVVFRTRRTYELLEVVHVEESSSIAIAKRTPSERRPRFFLGPEGETLVWIPLPAEYRQPQDDHDIESSTGTPPQDTGNEAEESGQAADEPPEQDEQEDELWEQALPLNSVNVGDLVVPAVPIPATAPGASLENPVAPSSPPGPSAESTPYEQGRTYDWMKPAE